MKLNKFIRPVLALVTKPTAILLPIMLFFAGWWFALPPADHQHDHAAQADHSAAADPLWTCSMHPQIRQPNAGLCPICNMDLIPLTDSGQTSGLRELGISAEAAALLDIRVSPVVQAPADVSVKMFGKIDFDERSIVTTTARVAGRLDRLFADFTGTTVSRGDAIAEIYSPELVVAQHTLIRAFHDWKNARANDRAHRLSMLESAREKMRLLNLSEAQIKQIENQDEPTDHITLLAPQSGIIVDLMVKEGQYVKTGDPIFGIAQLDSVWLKMEAFESDLQWLRYAQNVTFTVDALPNKSFHGPIAFIDPQLDSQRRTVKVRVNVKNENFQLKPGMFATASVQTNVAADGRVLDADLAGKWISPMHPEIVKDEPGSCDICGMPLVRAEDYGFIAPDQPAENPLLIPASAVLRTGQRAVVYLRIADKPEPTFVGREIVLGPRAGDFFIVNHGLDLGELVVTHGAFKLDSELQIQAKPSMMNPNAGLDEQSANQAPSQLASQWSAVMRQYGKLISSADRDEGTFSSQLAAMADTINQLQTDQLTTDELALWEEFSMRLGNLLAELQKQPSRSSSIAQLRRQLEETRRFTGLSATAIMPAAADASWILPLQKSVSSYLTISQSLSQDQSPTSENTAALSQAVDQLPASPEKSAILAALGDFSQQSELAGQRATFKPLSESLVASIRKFAIDQLGELYLVHCPMADDNRGANWLSAQPIVENPYFGSGMFACGSVTDTLSTPAK